MTGPQPPTGRRRRRAVGPVGARPAEAVEDLDLDLELDVARQPPPAEEQPVDDDERLRREVPPHHGT